MGLVLILVKAAMGGAEGRLANHRARGMELVPTEGAQGMVKEKTGAYALFACGLGAHLRHISL